MPRMRPPLTLRLAHSTWLYVLATAALLAILFGLVGWAAYEYDPRVHYRVQEALGEVRGRLRSQPEVVPTPILAGNAPTGLPALAAPATPSPSASPPDAPTHAAATSAPASPTVAPTATPIPPTATPLPGSASLSGVKHEYQLYNNCGPATLAMNLSFWGWTGNQRDAAQVLKPDQDDKNVSPRELYEYALTQGFDAYIRVGGDLDTLRRFIAAGYPVLVEKGFYCQKGERCTGWFGHYSLFTAYDDAQSVFTLQDSFRGPNMKMSYADVMDNWRAFNYLYLVVFPAGPERDQEVKALLGPALDVDANYRDALARAQAEALTSTGDLGAFAWFNVGTNLHNLQDYAGAAVAYDQARQIGLPYRMLWYQFGPYRSYYYMARYSDVVDLATFAIDSVTTVPGLEEAYYWRGMSERALGQPDAAAEDFRTALERHPGFQPASDALAEMGLSP
jgi:tetratricopeptide (TPR) repeat protein